MSDAPAPDARPGLARRPAALTAVVSAAVVIALAVVLVPWDWVPGGTLTPMPASELFTPAQIQRAEEFHSLQRWLGWSSYFLSLAVALVLGFTRWGATLVRRSTARLPWWLAVPLGVLLLLVIGRLVTLPFSLALRQEDLDYGLTNQALSGWATDYLKSLLVDWVVTGLVVLVLVGFARRSPRHWCAWAGGTALVLTFVGSFVYPLVVEPLFNTFTPMPDGPLKQSILRLADEEGVHVDTVLVSDASRRTTTANAYVSGFGSSRRIVVYDTLLHEFTPAQARVVIAHELGHAKHRDVLVGTALGAVGSVGAVAVLALLLDSSRLRWRAHVVGPADPAVVAPVLALIAVGSFLVSPLQNTVSRAVEARADRASLHATHEGRVFIEMQKRLALTSLADPTPPTLSQFWWGSHPTVLQRAGLPASLRAAGDLGER